MWHECRLFKLKKNRCHARDSNAGPHDGRHRQIHLAMDGPPSFVSMFPIYAANSQADPVIIRVVVILLVPRHFFNKHLINIISI